MSRIDPPVPTARQIECLAVIRTLNAETGTTPGLKEIGARLGDIDHSAVSRLIKGLIRAGRLKTVCRRGQRTRFQLTRPLEEYSTADLTAELTAREASAPPLHDNSTALLAIAA